MPAVTSLGDRCCGCGACVASCPAGALMMMRDALGFEYPMVDERLCSACGACERACPVIMPSMPDAVDAVSWAVAEKAVCDRTSSGGMFGALAGQTLVEGGVVYGASFAKDFRSVCHARVTREDGLDEIMRSKYVQSSIAPMTYTQVRSDLEQGRRVLFAGTACQVAGLRGYLDTRVDFGCLTCCDVICHGVPSPRLWASYVSWVERYAGAPIEGVNFRDKSLGWERYSMAFRLAGGRRIVQMHDDNWYLGAFLCNASLRPSCFCCPAKGRCGSDLTLGDFWGAPFTAHELADVEGVSAVIVRSAKGKEAFERESGRIQHGATSYSQVLAGNPSLEWPAKPFARYRKFMSDVAAGRDIGEMQLKWRFYASHRRRLRARLLGLTAADGAKTFSFVFGR